MSDTKSKKRDKFTPDSGIVRYLFTMLVVSLVSLIILVSTFSVMLFTIMYGIKINRITLILYGLIIGINSIILVLSIRSFVSIYGKHNQLDDKERIISTDLTDNEKTIIAIIERYGGRAMQNQIVKDSGFSPATVSRILNALENKGIIQRRRYGMTNEIFLLGKIHF
ncbi:MarR family transcriptional regulator [Thermoplasma sp.]|uniref:helix-turn-helix transcriptional regulator n=1 Tax=Thermoplasma sp. TaxID=1973142 RepID=UPI00260ED342|nr:MarR family transcriptional regulator [Thermoplasma sp.]